MTDPGAVVVPGGLVVLVGDDGCGASTLLRSLVRPGAVLLPQPPGDDWSPSEAVGEVPLLEELGYRGGPDRELWTLSGGERQRVRLARALSAPADLLLLDEPFGYLDGPGVQAVLALLRGRTAVVVAKAEPRAERAAHRVLVVRDGSASPA